MTADGQKQRWSRLLLFLAGGLLLWAAAWTLIGYGRWISGAHFYAGLSHGARQRFVAGGQAGWILKVLNNTSEEGRLLYLADHLSDADWLAAYYLYPRDLQVRPRRVRRDPSLLSKTRRQGLEAILDRPHLLLATSGSSSRAAARTTPSKVWPPPPLSWRGGGALLLTLAAALGWGAAFWRFLMPPWPASLPYGTSLAGRVGLGLVTGLGILGGLQFFAALVSLAATFLCTWGLTLAGLSFLVAWHGLYAPPENGSPRPRPLFSFRRRHRPPVPPAGSTGMARSSTLLSAGSGLSTSWQQPLHGVLGLILILLCLLPLGRAFSEPMHHWDERFQWAYKAKILLHENGIHGPAFQAPDRLHLHRHYPLLIPALEAHLSRLAGERFSERAVKGLFPFFFMALLTMAHAAFRSRLAATPALLLTCLLAALPPFHLARLVEGGPAHTGFADLPLAAWLAGAALLLWAGSPRDRGGGVGRLRNAGALGVLAGLMAMTKPEGAVMLIAVLAGLVMSAGPLKAQRRRPILKAAGVALALCLPRLLLILLVPASGAVGYSGDEAYLARLTPAGLATGLRINFLPAAASLLAAPFTLHWALVGLLPLTGFLAGKTTGTRGRHLLLPLLLLPLGADLLAFTVTGSGIVWHLSVALDRLWLQVVPILLMVAAGQWSRLASLDGQRAAGDQPGR